MAKSKKGNDKKFVKQARDLLVLALGNLLWSHRERKFKGVTREEFCRDKKGLTQSNVFSIETGGLLKLDFEKLRFYLASSQGRDNKNLMASLRKVYDGLKELDEALRML